MVVQQYPHYLYVRHQQPSERLDNGDFIAGDITWTLHARCREETNGGGQDVWTADQRAYTSSAIIQMPRGTARIPEGTTVLVSDRELTTDDLEVIWHQLLDLDERKAFDSQSRPIKVWDHGTEPSTESLRTIVRITGDCRKFDVGQLHCRLWL